MSVESLHRSWIADVGSMPAGTPALVRGWVQRIGVRESGRIALDVLDWSGTLRVAADPGALSHTTASAVESGFLIEVIGVTSASRPSVPEAESAPEFLASDIAILARSRKVPPDGEAESAPELLSRYRYLHLRSG